MKDKEQVGAEPPTHNTKIYSSNNDLNLCRKCESTQIDRKYSPKTGLVKTTSPVFVVKGGN